MSIQDAQDMVYTLKAEIADIADLIIDSKDNEAKGLTYTDFSDKIIV